MGDVSATWRVDELARRSGLSVDTVRFYLREGLLPPARREGRLTWYGPAHLLRLDQIHALQMRQLSLGAIRALLEANHLGIIEALFATGEGNYTRDDLLEASKALPETVDHLTAIGLLGDPQSIEPDRYDNRDVQVLEAWRGLVDLGIPEPVVTELATIYVETFDQLQERVLGVFAGEGTAAWDADERREFATRGSDLMGAILPLTERLLNYVHHRAVQRMTLRTTRLAEPE